MERQTFLKLLDKYLNGVATQVERGLLEEYYKRLNDRGDFELSAAEENLLDKAMLQNIRLRIAAEQNPVREMPVRRLKLWPRIAAAACAILVLSIGGYFLLHKSPKDLYTVNQ